MYFFYVRKVYYIQFLDVFTCYKLHSFIIFCLLLLLCPVRFQIMYVGAKSLQPSLPLAIPNCSVFDHKGPLGGGLLYSSDND